MKHLGCKFVFDLNLIKGIKNKIEDLNNSNPPPSNRSTGGRAGGSGGGGGGPVAARLPVALEESPPDQQVYVNLADG